MRKMVTFLVAAGLLLAGCASSAAPATQVSTGPAPSKSETATAPGTGASTGSTGAVTTPATGGSQATGTQGQGGNNTKDVSGASQTDYLKAGPAKDPVQAAHWHPRDIGYPLVTEDPVPQGTKVVMLSFDDGPTREYTPQVLDILKENGVNAMFFVTGYGAKNDDLVKREAAEGHTVGSHTLNHDNLTQMTEDKARHEINTVNDMLVQILGQKPKYFRPPYGSYNKTVLHIVQDEDGMQLINWDDGSLDWAGVDKNGYKDPKQVVADVMKLLHNGAVILMHDTHKHTVEALPEVIKEIKAQGYQFVVMR